MELHQLRYFVEVARHENFSRAAKVCNVAQPSLSQQLKKLEEELGEPLFRRGRRGAQLTDFGRMRLPLAQHILTKVDELKEQAESESAALAGRVRVGAIPTVAPYLLPELVRSTGQWLPRTRLLIEEHTTENLLRELHAGRLDFAILSPPFSFESEFSMQALFDDELLLALPADSPLSKRTEVDLITLSQLPMVGLKDVHCLSRQSVSLCEASGLRVGVTLKYAQLETVVSMVEAGLGFSFVPKIARAAFAHRKVVLVSVGPHPVTRSIVLAWPENQELSSTQRAFKELLLSERFLGRL